MRKVFTIIILFIFAFNTKAQNTLNLEQCRSLALSNSFASKEASLSLSASKLQRREALTEYFPRLSFNTFAFRSYNPLFEIGINDIFKEESMDLVYDWTFENGLKNTYALPKYAYSSSITLIQPIFTGLRIVNGNKLAELGVKASGLQLDVQKRKTIEELDEYYWQTVSLEEKLRTLASFRSLLETLNNDALNALNSGLVTEDDYLQVKLKLNEIKATEVKLKNGIKLSKMNLLNYIGYEYEFLKLDSLAIDVDNEKLLSPNNYYVDENQVAASLEETDLLDLNIQAKKLEKAMDLGETLPQVLVGASYSYYALGEKDKFNAIAFASISIPISSWWKTSIKQQRLQTEIDKATEQREYLGNQLVLFVRKSWVELCSAWDEWEIASESMLVAQQSYNRQKVQYEAGIITMSELLKSQASYQQTVSNESDARIEYKKSLQRWRDLVK